MSVYQKALLALLGKEPTEDELAQLQSGAFEIGDLPQVRQLLDAQDERIADLKEKSGKLETKVAELEAKTKTLEVEAEAGRKHLEELRERTRKAYRAAKGDKAQDAMIALIDESGAERLAALHTEYASELESKFPLKCAKCGHEHLSRAQAESENPDTDEEPEDSGDFIKLED